MNDDIRNGIKRPNVGCYMSDVWKIADRLSFGRGSPAFPTEVCVEATKTPGLSWDSAKRYYFLWKKFHGVSHKGIKNPATKQTMRC